MRLGLMAVLAAAMGLSACADDYGYGGLSAGYGGYYGDPYYAGGFGGPALGYGWYNDYYYPGTGYYVYDRNRRPYRWSDGQRRYWSGRPGYGNPAARANWADFRRDYRAERRDYRGDLARNRDALRAGTITRDQYRQGRRDARTEFRRDVRQDYRDLRRDNRAVGAPTPRPDRAFGRPGGGRGEGFGRPGGGRGGFGGGGFRGGRGSRGGRPN